MTDSASRKEKSPSQGKKSVCVGSLPFDLGPSVEGEDPNQNSNLGLGFFDGEYHE